MAQTAAQPTMARLSTAAAGLFALALLASTASAAEGTTRVEDRMWHAVLITAFDDTFTETVVAGQPPLGMTLEVCTRIGRHHITEHAQKPTTLRRAMVWDMGARCINSATGETIKVTRE